MAEILGQATGSEHEAALKKVEAQIADFELEDALETLQDLASTLGISLMAEGMTNGNGREATHGFDR